ncbi:CD3073 family putative ECF transporter S component [Azotosporobacter soli]|uniref:CD3073 family putative ECF transporter S component n=1 Tax=Azotosporobacter soli TaxID=3055040 RepID=UPI0031FF3A2E
MKEVTQLNRSAFMLTFSAICLAINLVLGMVMQSLKIPLLYLDTLGTMLGAAVLGPWYGAAIGGLTNVVQGVLTNPVNIPFALVNVAIGLTVGWVARRYGFGWKVALPTGLFLAVAAPLVGTPIAIWIFGGLGGSGTDFLVLWLLKSGQGIFSAAFWPRIVGNLVDKIGCALLTAFLLKRIPLAQLLPGKRML